MSRKGKGVAMFRRIYLLICLTGLVGVLFSLEGCAALRASKVHGPASAEKVDAHSRQDKDLDSK